MSPLIIKYCRTYCESGTALMVIVALSKTKCPSIIVSLFEVIEMIPLGMFSSYSI